MFEGPFGSQLFIFNKNLHKYLNDNVLKYDLNYIQMLFLIRIDKFSNVSQKDLADIFFLTKGYVAKSIKDLENKGFIIRSKGLEDKRQYKMQLTEKALNLIPEFKKINSAWEEKMGLNEINDEFFDTFKKLTRKSIELNEDD
ncbi:MAG: MarR family winged helix-turn-helix transcriptional regulator [Methanobrevibacter sp.]|uniref:MarR family winged helix-turn-helix transcriptional regulator n=1 Tax=Methanobrevibacter sp. TaxID=66852 RepID=UPI0026DEFFC6|nr:MarR family winged helix-turn-helix transcriptional regulator [Methanobrevibacter sp.]MDO5848610.1 MarR family winged helix-turn-helix transcriptional regulator [Methanobrevibacter sp.]